jgi:hypothetical protein
MVIKSMVPQYIRYYSYAISNAQSDAGSTYADVDTNTTTTNNYKFTDGITAPNRC